jgi:hypothetical protein
VFGDGSQLKLVGRKLAFMPRLYAVIGWYGIGFGLYSVPTALFVNLYFLLISAAHVLVGIISLSIARGFAGGKPWAWWSGVFMSLGILLVFIVGLMQSVHENDTSGVVHFVLVSLYFLAVFLATLRHRQSSVDQPE